jgi:hypothetical protein
VNAAARAAEGVKCWYGDDVGEMRVGVAGDDDDDDGDGEDMQDMAGEESAEGECLLCRLLC